MTFVMFVSLFCLAIHVSFIFPDMILTRFGDWLFDRLPEWLSKPLFACLPCMGSFWTLVFYTFTTNIDVTKSLFHTAFNIPRPETGVIVTMFAVIGCNALIAVLLRLAKGIENLERFDE